MNLAARLRSVLQSSSGIIGALLIFVGFLLYYLVVQKIPYTPSGFYQIIYSIAFLLINLGGLFSIFKILTLPLSGLIVLGRDYWLAVISFAIAFILYWI